MFENDKLEHHVTAHKTLCELWDATLFRLFGDGSPRLPFNSGTYIRVQYRSGTGSNASLNNLSSHNMTSQVKTGSLIVVGTGIESVGQMTLQALSYIEAASKVFYCVLDPATEAFILSKNKNSVDLYQYYDDGKSRIVTYTQMAEV